ncbi:MAG: porin, partial [Alcaligenaceae bacterium]
MRRQMNRLHIAAIAALTASTASAQSNVNLYGLIDVSVNSVRFAPAGTAPALTYTTLSSDASRLGFRGTEDLGSGRRAYFKLEIGYQLDTGAQTNAAQLWNREAFVGLGDQALGSIQLGSQFSPEVYSTGKVDPFGRFGLGSITTLFQGGSRGWSVTSNNAIQYIT